MKAGPFILAVVLLGAVAMPASFAEDAASTAGHPEGSNPSAEPHGSPPPAGDAGGLAAKPDNHAPAENASGPKSEGNAGPQQERNTSDKPNLKAGVDGGPKGGGVKTGEGSHTTAKGGNSLDTHAGGADAIDTHITAPSRRTQNTSDKTRHPKSNFKIVTPGNIYPRRPPARGAVNPAARNAIGVPVTRHEGMQERSTESHGVPGQGPPHEVPGNAASGAGSLSRSDGALERPTIARPSVGPITTVHVPQRGTINGTGLVRRNSAPSGLGGPAKAVAGISGSGIRPKHP